MSKIRDLYLADAGRKKIAWVKDFMPVLRSLEEEYSQCKPLFGTKVAVCVHLEAKTAYLCHVLRAAGAEVYATGSNPLSTKDDVCAALAADGFQVNAWFDATAEEYREHIRETLSCRPHLIVDDGGDFVKMLHDDHPEYAVNLLGGSEETTTGILRLKARAQAGKLNFPMVAVNDAYSKYLFDNHHGTGQSVWDALMYTTNVMLSGKTVVVAGYGHCSSGIAERAKGLGARVIVTEINPFRALEAAMDGFQVLTMDEAAPLGDIFITSTGCTDVITRRHFERMKDNVLLANAGHFDVEVSRRDLEAMAVKKQERKPFIDGYTLEDGRVLNLLAEGRLVNIAAGNGHPADIMDLSFSLQFLSAIYIKEHAKHLAPGLYAVPAALDEEVAYRKARAMGLRLDKLTPEQEAYLRAE